jgi:hypothetical protein
MSNSIQFANLSSSQLQDLKDLEEKLTGNSGNNTIVIAYSQKK